MIREEVIAALFGRHEEIEMFEEKYNQIVNDIETITKEAKEQAKKIKQGVEVDDIESEGRIIIDAEATVDMKIQELRNLADSILIISLI